jgi:putative addiction module component (TIGR02574 family)
MPFGRCPVCGAMYHMSIGLPVEEWYRRYYPQVPVGAEVTGECFQCWIPLRLGHRVTVRAVPTALTGRFAVGAEGIVTGIEPGPPPAYLVEFGGAGAVTARFRRDELWYLLGQAGTSPMPVSMKAFGLDKLSADERLALLEEIWDSLAANPEAVPVTDAQKGDLQRRLDAYRDDPKAGSPWEEVKARLQGRK